MMDYVITVASRPEIDEMINWAAREGWNPGLDDAACFHAADAGGFLAGRIDGRMIACISAVRYGPGFGFIGFYIVDPAYRGQGYGWTLWQAAIEHLGSRCIGLDGVVDQQDNYAKSGFRLVQNNIRYGGVVDADIPQDPALVALDQADADLLAYDSAFFAGSRADFTSTWLASSNAGSFAIERDGRIRGYGTIRQCRDGHKIGPLFADNSQDADLLFRALAAKAPGEPLYLDVPDPNKEAMALAERYGLEPSFQTARMYKGPIPDLPMDRCFGITSFELG